MSNARFPIAAPRGALHKLLHAHPESLGESYGEHARIAARFGARMVAGGVKCLIHAVLPALFARAASECVGTLSAEIDQRRAASAEAYPDYVI